MSNVIQRCFLPISFFREYPCELNLALADEETPHLRPMVFACGLAGTLDSLSGMSVSLPAMDQWAKQFLQQARQQEWASLFSFFQAAEKEIQLLEKAEKGILTRLELQDEKDVRWIFFPPKNSKSSTLRWRQKLPVVVADRADWLIAEAEAFVPLDSVNTLRGKSWASWSDFTRTLEQESKESTVTFSLRDHLTGTERTILRA